MHGHAYLASLEAACIASNKTQYPTLIGALAWGQALLAWGEALGLLGRGEVGGGWMGGRTACVCGPE